MRQVGVACGETEYILVRCESSSMNLHAARAFWSVGRANFVEAQDLARRVVQTIMVDLERCQSSIEGELDVRCPRSVLQGSHVGVLRRKDRWLRMVRICPISAGRTVMRRVSRVW